MASSRKSKLPHLELDPKRVKRAHEELRVVVLGQGQFRVQGKVDSDVPEYYYYVRAEPHPICCCSDAAYRAGACKHIIAAMIQSNDPRLLALRPDLGRRDLSIPDLVVDPRTGAAYPDRMTLAEASEVLATDDERARSKRLAGRILTDPDAGPAEWKLIAERATKLHVRAALLRVPAAAADPAIRRLVVDREPSPTIIYRLLPFTEGEEYRLLFRKLVECGKAEAALDMALADKRSTALRPSDLAGLLAHTSSKVRTKTFFVLGKMTGEEATALKEKVRKGRAAASR